MHRNILQPLILKEIMEPIDPVIQAYADHFTSSEDPLLHQVARSTAAHPRAHMLSGQVQGKFLEILSILMRPNRILEIGTFTGYSALCLAKGLQPGGKLHTIELREEDAASARDNFNHSNYKDSIILHTGNALTIIPELDEAWDLVFIDADKTGYCDYYRLVLPRLKRGGVMLADNVLFHGQVVEKPVTGKNAKAIHEFNECVRNDESVEQVLLTIRDGLMLIRKK